jgi:hypothetical protein
MVRLDDRGFLKRPCDAGSSNVMANTKGTPAGPVVKSELLPDLSKLPGLPGKVSGKHTFGHMVGFQLVNCTPLTLDVKTFDQHKHDAKPNKVYKVAPKGVVYCTAKANKEPFDIQYIINNQLGRAIQSTRVFVIKVGPSLLNHALALSIEEAWCHVMV